jgi:uncharacterized oxidoreductase
MPLDAFIAGAMALLHGSLAASEIVVERARTMRSAERDGRFDDFFRRFNAKRERETR